MHEDTKFLFLDLEGAGNKGLILPPLGGISTEENVIIFGICRALAASRSFVVKHNKPRADSTKSNSWSGEKSWMIQG